MEAATEAILQFLVNKRYIGRRHFPEKKLISSRTKWLSKEERRAFEKEYKTLLSENYLTRTKKRTGKGTEWHIALNPRKIREIYEVL
ncbi:hypothetical protein A3B57_00755 [Microgenomates group bacterium RIFCSPLOWO2_01_FULL_47_10]|nr:MAG: hypothetical protein A3B57_00755 [Microgenomates group bacterium RIFCSPLOWO2_01_FULL_47_10]